MPETQKTEVKLQAGSFPHYLAEMLRKAQVQEGTFPAGQKIFMDGSAGTEAYFLLSGSVHILKRNDRGENNILDVLEPGSIFGEMALLDQSKRSATAQAATDCRVFVIPKTQVQQLVASVPQVAIWLLQVFSRRIRLANQKIAEMEKIQQLNHRIMLGQENERKRIARDIQEGPAQQFSDYIMRTDICQHLARRGDKGLSDELENLKDALTKGLSRIQNVICLLTPEALHQEGLCGILRRYVGRIQEDAGLTISFSCPSIGERDVDYAVQNTVFCLVQSALSNVQAFAQAKTVELEISVESGMLTLRVADDGNGFDIDKVAQGYYRSEMENYESMRDRVMLVGGQMRIQSHPGEGTLVEMTMPLKPTRQG
ncbi:MAG: cyclic nucleotide-binding domain-containing protein [Candidatus Riflebacteria bacterium]|nr:cyclic nucleotide-binding domain-containing protein [Candidatus Riflebacteria bacterium]